MNYFDLEDPISLARLDQPMTALQGLTGLVAVSYTHLRAHETVLDLVCRLLLEKKNKTHISCR